MKTLITLLIAGMLGACVAPSEVTLQSETRDHDRGYYVDPINPTIVVDRDYSHRPRWHRQHHEVYEHHHH